MIGQSTGWAAQLLAYYRNETRSTWILRSDMSKFRDSVVESMVTIPGAASGAIDRAFVTDE